MSRAFIVTILAAGVLVGTSACDAVDDLVGNTDEAEFTEELLNGSRLLFTPDVARGGVPEWEYHFTTSGGGNLVEGCNHEDRYTSTGWVVLADDQVRVNFGQHWEEYTLERGSGSLADGSLSGRFEYEASVDLVPGGTDMEGSFIQLSGPRYC